MGNHTRELLLMVGESGSGKSTYAKKLSEEKGYVRLNRDDLRIELAPLATDPGACRFYMGEGAPALPVDVFIPKNFKGGVGGRDFEDFVGKVERGRAAHFLSQDKNVVVDNTHLNPNTVEKWRNFCNHKASFDIYRMTTPMDECIRRDAGRAGKARVGRPVIERQFLVSKRLPIDVTKPIVLVDVDGTVASHMDENGKSLRSPYSEDVHVDGVWQSVIDEVNRLYDSGHTVIIVSGRKSTCGDATVAWLNSKGVKFHFIFMRHSFDNRSDVLVKQDILRELLGMVDKNLIERVIDDRPRVIKDCWMANDVPVTPVFGGKFLTEEEFTTDHVSFCEYAHQKGYRRCPSCLALEDF